MPARFCSGARLGLRPASFSTGLFRFSLGLGTGLILFLSSATAVATGMGRIAGTKFSDDNGNGSRDFGEAGLPGWVAIGMVIGVA